MLIANMVGRNEEGRFLEDVLQHLSNIVDLIIFTDDCSTDDTLRVASKYAETFQTTEPLFSVDEGRLRSLAWENLQKYAKSNRDWVLAIDCDEKLFSTEPSFSMQSILEQDTYDVVNIRFFHMWNERQYRVDKLWAPNNSSRLFRFFDGGQYVNRKLACGSEPTYVNTLISRGKYLKNSSLVMQHLGYVNDEDKRMKHERYMQLDGGDFHQKSHIESIMDEDPVLLDWAIYA